MTREVTRPRLWRSILFVPAVRPELIAKACRSRADLVVVDLEDATPAAHKDAARTIAIKAISALDLAGGRPPVFVRVNAISTAWFDYDVESCVSAAIPGLVVPKLNSAAEMSRVAESLRRAERRANAEALTLVAGLETVAGVDDAAAILSATERVKAAYFGAEDFATDLGARRTRAGVEVLYARSRVVIAARLALVVALDQVVLDFNDEDAFALDANLGRDLGYAGKLCIHPSQVEVANAVFTPSADEMERGRRLLAKYDAAVRRGVAVIDFEGQMVDAPIASRARALVAAAEAAEASEATRKQQL